MTTTQEKYIKKYLHQRVRMTSTYYTGELGVVETIEYPTDDPKAIFGFKVYIRLQSEALIISYKSEDFTLL